MTDLRAHTDICDSFPSCPASMEVSLHKSKDTLNLLSEKDGTLIDTALSAKCGNWWGMSATCLLLDLQTHGKFYFRLREVATWESADGTSVVYWKKKRGHEGSASKLLQRTPVRVPRPSALNSTPNLSRFRMTILPLDKLDAIHKEQLDCLGFRICYHGDVGRVLVSTRRFETGEIIIYSKVQATDVVTDDDVLNIVNPADPSCCYLLVPRIKKLYYNKGTFSHEDPVMSGDLWYLVNHSTRPNTEVQLRAHGIQLKAKNTIQPYEPITWTYPFGFFGKDEEAVDLPQNILPDDSVVTRE